MSGIVCLGGNLLTVFTVFVCICSCVIDSIVNSQNLATDPLAALAASPTLQGSLKLMCVPPFFVSPLITC